MNRLFCKTTSGSLLPIVFILQGQTSSCDRYHFCVNHILQQINIMLQNVTSEVSEIVIHCGAFVLSARNISA
jgi:hypothetical protein